VAAQLVEEHDEVTFVGTPNGLEARLVPEAGISFRALASRGFDRARLSTLVVAAFTTVKSTYTAWRWLGESRPDVVLGFGAYVSLPVGLAAVLRGVPLVLHEQNSVPGLANKILSRWAAKVCVTYEESAALLAHPERSVTTGNPVRSNLLASSRESGRQRLELNDNDLVLLVFGGSRGARHINSALVSLRERMLSIESLVVIHVAGANEAASVREALGELAKEDARRWRVLEYLPGMGDAIAAADLVVCRAGATTIAELTALGAAAIVVPYPYATDDHQTKNAATLVAHNAAILIADAELDSDTFAEALIGALGDPGMRANMSAASRALGRPDAAKRVGAIAREVARPRVDDQMEEGL